jgi:glycosyltransferase involved in cell wall biosynthesis
MRGISFDILKPFISDNFEKQTLPPKPVIAIHSRDQRDSINIIKAFYIKFPQYRWITFRDMRGLSEKDFASTLKDCFLSVWVDETSGFGTYPLESMKVGVPVLGLVPNLLPSWMNENNGLWVNNKNQIVDFIADFLQNWLEDNVKPELHEEMLKTVENLSTKEEFEKVTIELFEGYINTRLTSFEEQLSKFETTE